MLTFLIDETALHFVQNKNRYSNELTKHWLNINSTSNGDFLKKVRFANAIWLKKIQVVIIFNFGFKWCKYHVWRFANDMPIVC